MKNEFLDKRKDKNNGSKESKMLNMVLNEYSEHYNYKKPYGDIGYATPAKKYFNGLSVKIHNSFISLDPTLI